MVFKIFTTMLLTLLFSGYAVADWVATQSGSAVIATKQGCPKHILSVIQQKYGVPANFVFHKATGLIDGQQYVGCWTASEGKVLVIWEDGDYDVIPEDSFREMKEV